MEFLTKKIYKTAIDYAKEQNHPEIVGILAKGPIQTDKSSSNQEKKADAAYNHTAASKKI